MMLQRDGKGTSKSSASVITARKYGDEWDELSGLAERGLSHVQQHVVQMNLQGSRLRSIYWQLLLDSLPCNPSLWISILRQQRNSYRLLHQRLTVYPHQANAKDNPLSQSSSSVWNQYFCDEELRALIRQDVVRTFLEEELFRSESIQLTMVNILFCYAREHPEICYRQGMHEVLAPLLYVLHYDQKSLAMAKQFAHVSDRAAEILDPAWLEEDAYWLFCKLMSHLAGNYRIKNMTPLQTGYFPASVCNRSQNSKDVSESELATRLTHIQDELLPLFDQELYEHLKSLHIPFQTFGIRWLRLLFGQEFPLSDLLHIWDSVFAEGDGLVNYIVVSMLSAIRDQLIVEDDTECLMLLMRYPSGVDVKTIIENALHMWNPEIFKSTHEVERKKVLAEPVVEKSSSQPSSISRRLKKLSLWSQKKDTSPGQLPQTSNSLSASSTEKPAIHNDGADGVQTIVEGLTYNDPMVAKAEIQHLHYIISLVHSHLKHHLATLEHTLPSNTPPAGKAALDGIKQLSAQLSRTLSAAPRCLEVEAASEAQPQIETATEIRNLGSESSSKKQDLLYEMKELESYEGQELLTHFPLDLHFQEMDTSLHVSFREVLGTCTR